MRIEQTCERRSAGLLALILIRIDPLTALRMPKLFWTHISTINSKDIHYTKVLYNNDVCEQLLPEHDHSNPWVLIATGIHSAPQRLASISFSITPSLRPTALVRALGTCAVCLPLGIESDVFRIPCAFINLTLLWFLVHSTLEALASLVSLLRIRISDRVDFCAPGVSFFQLLFMRRRAIPDDQVV